MSLTALQKVMKVLKIVGGDQTAKMFIFTMFKGSRPIDAAVMLLMQRCILATVAASGIPRATPQKHKDSQRF